MRECHTPQVGCPSPELALAQLWDPSLGVSGGYTASLRRLIMKLSTANVANTRICEVIRIFVDHFDLPLDIERLPSDRVVGRITGAELDAVCNAHIVFKVLEDADGRQTLTWAMMGQRCTLAS